MPRFVAASLLLALVGCDAATDALDAPTAAVYERVPEVRIADADDYHVQREALLARLDVLIGRAETRDASMCALLPIGEKACGGPHDYRVYAATPATAAEIVATGRRLVGLDRAGNQLLGRFSSCELPAPPRVRYEGGRCVASRD